MPGTAASILFLSIWMNRGRKYYYMTISQVFRKFAIHSTTKTAQKPVMKAFIGTSGRASIRAERSICIRSNVAKNIISEIPHRAGRGLLPIHIVIAQRPEIIGAKSRLGDWEYYWRETQRCHNSIVERKTKLTILVLLDGPTSEPTKEGIIRRLTLRKKHVLTLTSDNRKVFPGHSKISEKLGSAFYFCAPYISWERGLNENINWLVRKYLL